jgi:hypothetical protein
MKFSAGMNHIFDCMDGCSDGPMDGCHSQRIDMCDMPPFRATNIEHYEKDILQNREMRLLHSIHHHSTTLTATRFDTLTSTRLFCLQIIALLLLYGLWI